MTVIVQQPTDSNGNPQPMVYDSDTGKIIVDSNGYVINGGKRLVNVPTVANYVSTVKTTTAGWQEAGDYALAGAHNNGGQALPIRIKAGGEYRINTSILWSPSENVYGFTLEGDSQNFTEIFTNVSDNYVITFDMTNFQFANITIKGIGGVNNLSKTCYGFLSADMSGTTNPYSATMYIDSVQLGTNTELWTKNSMYINQFEVIRTVNYADYNNVGSGAGSVGPYLTADSIIMIGNNFVSTCTVGGGTANVSIIGGYMGNSVIISSEKCQQLHIMDTTLGNLSLSPGITVNNVKLENVTQYSSNTVLIQNTGTTESYITNLTVDGYLYNNSSYTNFYDSYISLSAFKFKNIMSAGTSTTTIPIETPTTPSVPTSGTAQENTNPYAVDVYVYGGTVTEIQITREGTAYKVFSSSTGLGLSGQAFKLNPGDSITVTYSTAPDWEWMSD